MRTKTTVVVTLAVMSLCLIFLASTRASAQVPVRPNRPAQVPGDYVVTPFGFFHPSCVLRLAQGETLLAGGRVLQHADGAVEDIPACKYPHYAASGAITAAGATKTESPTINGWVESSSVVTNSTSYGEIIATWTVPPAPTSKGNEVVYFFPGLEDSNDVVSIIQPVLGWNMDDTGTPWTIASWNCCPSGITVESTPVNVNAGDTIVGTTVSTCGAGNESCPTWNITTADVTTGGSTTLGNTPSEGQTFNWAFGGVLEAYNISQCSDYPPNASQTFYDIALYDYNFVLIPNPDWSITYWAQGGSPQCNYNVQTTATQATLSYGTSGPVVSLSPVSLSWGKVVVGVTSKAKKVTLTNTGSTTLDITSIATSGDFALATVKATKKVTPCVNGATLASGAKCEIAVTFTPTQTGTRTGDVTFIDNASNSPQQLPLSGKGEE
ncbi:MAG: choice-of-anchor D domain-containing protein [Terriglobales bacterium]|jgi:hypothetical protein